MLNIYVDKKDENCMRDKRRKSHQLCERFPFIYNYSKIFKEFLTAATGM